METPALALDVLDRLRHADGTVVIEPPGDGYGFWAGGPSAVYHDGAYWLAYRLRKPVTEGRGFANVVARSDDGVHFETVATVTSAQFECASLERPALVPLPDGGGWRLYVSCSTLNSKHWWVEAIEADTAAGLADGKRTVVLPGDAATAWKDVVVSHTPSDGWQMWACRHPLADGDDEADRMETWYATSDDGLDWTLTAEPALAADPDSTDWDRRGRRVAAVALIDDVWTMLYDGRADSSENWEERTGLAIGAEPSSFEVVPTEPIGGHLRRPPGCGTPASWPIRPAGYASTSRPRGPTALTTCAPSTCLGPGPTSSPSSPRRSAGTAARCRRRTC